MENPKINALGTGQSEANTARRNPNTAARRSASSVNSRASQTPPQTTTKTAGRTSNYGVSRSPAQLTEGEVIKGEISDLRNNEITITLEDNTILKAHISDATKLSIGQTAAFRLTSISRGTILMEVIQNSYSETELTLINKALEEAGLPSTEHNQSTVKALMDNLLPINKSSIQHLMQQSYDYKTNDMSTLAIMNRLMMKMDEESVAQFSSYRNGTHQLMGQLADFSQNISSLLHSLSQNGPADAVSAFGDKLLTIALTDSGNEDNAVPTLAKLPTEMQQEFIELLSDTALTEDTVDKINDRSLSLHDALTLIRDSAENGSLKLPEGMTSDMLTQKLQLIESTLEQVAGDTTVSSENTFKNIPLINIEATEGSDSNPDDVKSEIPPENIADSEATAEEQNTGSRFGFANKFLQTISETARNSFNSTMNFLQQSGQTNHTEEVTNTIFDKLTEFYGKESHEHDFLNTFLSTGQRSELLDKLDGLPVSKSLLQKIATGEATAKEIVTVVKNLIPLSDSVQMQGILSSPVFEQIFEKFLTSSFTMTPEQLNNSGEVDSFYERTQKELSQFETLIQTALNGQDSENLSHSAHDMESSIEFMKTLSEAFSYMQIPLKLQNQNTNADLYVYTQKEKLKRNPDKVHVLLHLNLENLGPVDIYVDKNKNEVNTRFLLDNKPSIDLLKTNSDMLKDALNRQGYLCQVKVDEAEADTETSTLDEFINTKINTSATTDMKRFSFDIRA